MEITKTFKIIASTFAVILVLTGVVVLFKYISVINQRQGKATTKVVEVAKPVDPLSELQVNNKLFAEGVQASINGDYAGALVLLEKSKVGVEKVREKQIIDFNISDTKFNINRSSGAESFIELSKNESYSKRTRALAMVRVYLMYRKFNDPTILAAVVKGYAINAKTQKEQVYLFMKQIYAMYPFAYPAVLIANYELDSAKNANEANVIYSKYASDIYRSITEMKASSGELTETTSSMLARSNLLARLHLEFKAVPREEVEKSYEELVNYNQEKNVKVNKQYTLLYYANFESGIKDYVKAESVMNILLGETLETALKEALPTTNIDQQYPHLKQLAKNTQNQNIKTFIASIGSTFEN